MPELELNLSEAQQKNRVELVRPAYVTYGHPNLIDAAAFAGDFGLMETTPPNETTPPTKYFRGYGDLALTYVVVKTEAPEFFGVTFEVKSKEDLVKAARIPGASKIEDVSHQPGGGQRVTIEGPDGVPFSVIYGQKLVDPIEPPPQFEAQNFPAISDADDVKKPRKGRMQRPQKGPSPIFKLGHCGYVVEDIMSALEFYKTYFALEESDSIAHPEEKNEFVMVFLHVDRGKGWTDHHSFFLFKKYGKMKAGVVHHAAFEVKDYDMQNLGHDFLRKKGYKLQWGIGRHGPGSQVFDYWYDKCGFVLEHYSDGDIVNNETPFKRYGLAEGNIWGPDIPFTTSHTGEF
ncbi:hypothetical protein OIDMADRAFT_111241 [Oidiodendron maius Zn]|uniref:VOC domain-containing protein n=1 Tax=Oidiodendron maius (strain Zn) TaxID=913774 RepID=A0A0C3HEV4_OIDMZ|nr:hypothetical protein OIDMADRAFT_111241 [Oidiodendron maius Zn]